MTAPSTPLPAFPEGSIEAFRRDAEEASARVDQNAMAELLQRLPSTALLATLEAILDTLDAADPGRARRRAGLLGRLIGRDLVAMARVDDAETRLRLLLSDADEAAARLSEHGTALEGALAALQSHISALAVIVRRGSGGLESPGVDEDAIRRLLLHLEALSPTWRLTATQLAMAIEHGRSMLERHRQVRDLLVPLWRQRMAGKALKSTLAADESSGLRALQATVREELALLDQVSRLPAEPPSFINPTPKEPLP